MRCARLVALFVVLFAACGGSGRSGPVRIGAPSIPPDENPAETLEPGPTPSPSPAPTPTPTPGPTPTPLPPPAGATITSAAGTQEGSPNSFCWNAQAGGASRCYEHPPPSQPRALLVDEKETVLIRLEAQTLPDDESVRPFQGSRQGYPSQQIDPALETDLTVDLPKGEWSMDLCATWHGRGDPICWLFRFDVR